MSFPRDRPMRPNEIVAEPIPPFVYTAVNTLLNASMQSPTSTSCILSFDQVIASINQHKPIQMDFKDSWMHFENNYSLLGWGVIVSRHTNSQDSHSYYKFSRPAL